MPATTPPATSQDRMLSSWRALWAARLSRRWRQLLLALFVVLTPVGLVREDEYWFLAPLAALYLAHALWRERRSGGVPASLES